jgi:Na+/glutamate symporter
MSKFKILLCPFFLFSLSLMSNTATSYIWNVYEATSLQILVLVQFFISSVVTLCFFAFLVWRNINNSYLTAVLIGAGYLMLSLSSTLIVRDETLYSKVWIADILTVLVTALVGTWIGSKLSNARGAFGVDQC